MKIDELRRKVRETTEKELIREALGERKAREDAERRESERLKARQEEERIAKEREKLSVSEKKAGISQIKYLAVALVLGVLLLGYWMLAGSTDSIGMEFVQISAGEFDMGSPSNEKDRYDSEGPVHRVKISKGFYIGKYEVTQKQWLEIMGNNPSNFKGDNLPVEQVSWNDVQEFIKKLNEKKGTNKYRLPSEAEWEYAARAGTTTRYSFGDDESNLGDYAWYDGNSGFITHEVGQKKPNPWGLYDMHGNVWEWTQDTWRGNYNGAPTDGSAWGGSGPARVARCGSWNDIARSCRSAFRNNLDPGYRNDRLGFRLVMDL